MNEQQMHEFVLNATKELSALWESTKSAHKRIDESDKVTSGIHKLSASIAGMTAEMKGIAERMEESNVHMTSSIDRITEGQKLQGERIGNIEKAVLTIGRNEKLIEEHENRLDAIDKEPAAKWKNFTWLIFAGIVTAVVAFFIGKLL